METVSGSRLPTLKPLVAGVYRVNGADWGSSDHEREADAPPGLQQAASKPLAELVESELASYCRSAELAYAALVDCRGEVEYSICTVGACPHHESQIGALVSQAFSSAQALGGAVGEPAAQSLHLQGGHWNYAIERLAGGRLLFGIYSRLGLPAIVRACSQKSRAALDPVLAGRAASCPTR